jgi:hypothetical protein
MAMRALFNDDQMIAAVRAKPGIVRNGMPACGTVHLNRPSGAGRLESVRKNSRHHHRYSHIQTCSGAGMSPGRFLDGHGSLHFDQPVQIAENGQAAVIVYRRLDLRGRGYRIYVHMGKSEPEMIKIFIQELFEAR